jgi:hypothetical protein
VDLTIDFGVADSETVLWTADSGIPFLRKQSIREFKVPTSTPKARTASSRGGKPLVMRILEENRHISKYDSASL